MDKHLMRKLLLSILLLLAVNLGIVYAFYAYQINCLQNSIAASSQDIIQKMLELQIKLLESNRIYFVVSALTSWTICAISIWFIKAIRNDNKTSPRYLITKF